jgi:hypothetical protein
MKQLQYYFIFSLVLVMLMDFTACTGDPPEPGQIADLVLFLEADYLEDSDSCCSAFGLCNGAGQGGEGNPLFRVVSGQFNAESPPSLIELKPIFNQCIRCGC